MYAQEDKSHLGGYIIGISDMGDPNTYATEVWDWMIGSGIKSIIDIGCGQGYSTKYFIDKNIDAIGIEGGKIAVETSPVKDKLILHDYTTGKYITQKKYDAVWCCEFVEHVEKIYVDNFLPTFNCANEIFMTHAVPNQEGYHHVNCQPSEYWINKIEKLGFKHDNELSLYLRSITDKMHVKNTLLYFHKS